MKKTEDTNKNTAKKNPERAINNALDKFGKHIQRAGNAIKLAAKDYADAVAKYGEAAVEAFHNTYPGITTVTWNKFIRIAANKLIPQVILLSDRIAKKFEAMPLEQQQAQFGEKTTVPFVNKAGQVSEVGLADLSPQQENTVFKPNGEVRTIEEQIAYYQQQRVTVRSAYEVCGNILVVKRACKIGKDELVKILEGMK